MTTQEMHDWFDLMADKYDSPYFTDDEKDIFINRAHIDYVNEMAFGRDMNGAGAVVQSAAEMAQDWEHILHPLIKKESLASNSGGVITIADLETAIGGSLIKILSINDSASLPVAFTRSNDKYRFEQNYFKKTSATNKRFTILDSFIHIIPAEVHTYSIAALKQPAEIELGVTESELPAFTHNKIVAKALAYAGLGTENQALTQLTQMTN